MSSKDLYLKQQITENQLGRSSWEAEYRGEKCVAKLIDAENPHQKEKLVEILSRQVQHYQKLDPEDRSQIVLFREMVESESGIAFIRDWVEGDSLENQLSSDPVMWEKAARMVEKIADIMDWAHSRYTIFHGDLKPANIILNQEKMSIIDWDSMRATCEMEDMVTKTLSLEILGTPYYMAPEQCSGQKMDAKSDVYALGIVLYRLLTGVLPFENTPVLQLWTLKQNTEVPPILTSFPQLHLPMELGMLVDEALLIEPNYRIQTVHAFQEWLKNILEMDGSSCSTAATSWVMPSVVSSVAIPPPEPEEKKTLSGNLLLYGHTQAGKTVLATGLYSTSSEEFQVLPIDSDTQNFVQNVKTVLDSNAWPSATQGTLLDLRFKLLYRRWRRSREAIVTFKEYGGERVSREDFARSVMGTPEGVLFLFNPYTLQKRDAYERNRIMGEIKKCINELSKLPQKPQVAVVITAADTLVNSAKEFQPLFEKLVAEVTTSLTLLKMDWKRFEVSVCRPLADQNKPQLDPQRIQEPFLWLLGKKQSVLWWDAVRYVSCCLVGVLLLATFVGGLAYRLDKAKITRVQDRLVQIEKLYWPDQKEEYKNQLAQLIETFPPSVWFSWNEGDRSQLFEDICDKMDKARYEELFSRMEKLDVENFNEWAEELERWVPKRETHLGWKKDLESRLKEHLQPMMERAVFWLQTAKTNNSPEFDARYQRVQEFARRFWEESPEVEEVFRSQIAPLKESRLQKRIDTFVGNPQQLESLIEECEIYVEQDRKQKFSESKLTASLWLLVQKRVNEEMKRLKEKITDLDNPLDVDTTTLNTYSRILENSLFQKNDVQKTQQEISEFAAKTKVLRDEVEQKVVDDFLRDIRDEDVVIVLARFKFWLLDTAGPLDPMKRKEVEEVVAEKVGKSLEEWIDFCFLASIPPTEKDFLKIKNVCIAISVTPSEYIKNSPLFRFAKSYIHWWENESTISIRLVQLRASCSYAHGGYIHKINGQEGSFSWSTAAG